MWDKNKIERELQMGTKQNPGEFDCYANALPDEPMFTLLARDKLAPDIIRTWVITKTKQLAIHKKPLSTELDKMVEALHLADAMEDWRKTNDGKWRAKPEPEIADKVNSGSKPDDGNKKDETNTTPNERLKIIALMVDDLLNTGDRDPDKLRAVVAVAKGHCVVI
jgi:hypothetical protein